MLIEPPESFVSILAICSAWLATAGLVSLLWFAVKRRWRAVRWLIGLTALTLMSVVIGFLMVLGDCQGLHGGCSGHRFGLFGVMGFVLWFGSVPAYLAVLIWVWRRG